MARLLGQAVNPVLTSRLLEVRRQQELLTRSLLRGSALSVVGAEAGAGRTTVAALLASLLAEYGPTRVLAVDVDTRTPGLRQRLDASTGGSWHAVLAGFRLERPRPDTPPVPASVGLGWVRQHLAHSDGPDVLSVAPQEAGRPLGAQQYAVAVTRLGRWYRAIVTDTPADLATGVLPGVLRRADRIIVVGTATQQGMTAMLAYLKHLHATRPLTLPGLVRCVLVEPPGQATLVYPYARQALGLPLHVLPYDPALAEGRPPLWDALREVTRRAALRLAVEVTDGLQDSAIVRKQ
ncbi:MinD/ParA family protein [Actinosynnema sp. NPDC059797]